MFAAAVRAATSPLHPVRIGQDPALRSIFLSLDLRDVDVPGAAHVGVKQTGWIDLVLAAWLRAIDEVLDTRLARPWAGTTAGPEVDG